MREYDGHGPAGPLTTRAELAFGDLGGLAERLYPARGAVAQIAAFARDVLDLCTTDQTARAIADQAAAELAHTAAAACQQPEAGTTVSWTGRLLRHEGLRRRSTAALAARCPGVRLQDPASDALVGAAPLAWRTGEPFLALAEEIRDARPDPTVVLGYANGYPGYLPTVEAYPAQGYEVLASVVAPGGGENLARAASDLLSALDEEQS